MKLFNTILLLGTLSLYSNATTLKEVINNTLQNNQNIQAMKLSNDSKKEDYNSVKNTFAPTLSIGANVIRLDGDTRAVQVGTTSSIYAMASVNLYNGGKNDAIKKQKSYELESSKLNTTTNIKQTLLNVVTLFFQAKTINENINVFTKKGKTLKAQYDRVKQKYDIQMVTKDEVLKLQSEYETNKYTIEELKYKKQELIYNLNLLTSNNINTFDDSKLPNVKDLNYEKSETIKALEKSIQAVNEASKVISSSNMPQVKIEDKYSIYQYDDYNENLLQDLPEQQNQLVLSVNYKIFDTNTKSKTQSIKISKLALKKQLEFQIKNEKMRFELAKQKLFTQELKLKSLKSAVNMGNSVYDMIKEKYQNGIVDNITFLDALSKKSYNISLYNQALNDYEITKANYYFASGKSYKTIVSKF